MRHLFIVDPVPGLNPDADTSVVFMREAARRGHSVATCNAHELSVGPGGRARADWIETRVRSGRDWYELGARGAGELGEFDVVWMRKDPPYDLNYFFVTHLLDLVPPTTLVVNAPRGLREVTEKLFILRFPDLCPESLVSRSIPELLAFRDKLGGEMIVKPLDGCGGEGVFHLTPDDRNVRVVLELGTQHGTAYQIAQRYIPEVRQGDKRIIVVEGEPIGAVLRKPQHWETRANFHVGGTAVRTELTAREREICARIGPELRELGIVFAGIDVIGNWLTEINVTSPTGIQEINRLDGTVLESRVLDAVEKRFAALGEVSAMGIDPIVLRDQCGRTLAHTDFQGLGRKIEGKVRDCYVDGTRRTLVASDRISCFDVVVGTIPFKGQVLNQIAAFWFEKTAAIAPNHVTSVPDPCVTVGRECRPLPVEFVYRGYLTGVSSTSIWRAYEAGERLYCGHRLPEGMKKHQKLPEPLLTPTTKAEHGDHDALTSREELIASGAISAAHYDEAGAIAARLFAAGQAWAATRGLILVDTKYEMGLDAAGRIVVIDEIHTPDSSRYWYADGYAQAFARGEDPKSLDKEYVRRWLVEQGWRGEGAPPTLPDDVRCEAARRYIETFELVTGRAFEPATDEPTARIRRNLRLV